MRFLADMGVSITTVDALRAADHDAVDLREEGLLRPPDPEIVARAAREGRTVLTFDLDFRDILAATRKRSAERHHISAAKPDARSRESAIVSRDRRV